MCTSCVKGLPDCRVPGCVVHITATTWSHSNGHAPIVVYDQRAGCDDPACQEDEACCGKFEMKGGENMGNKEKMIAAFAAFQALVLGDGLELVEVEKKGDEDTLRFGLADGNGEVRAIILTDSSKYEAFGLGESTAGSAE